MTLKELKSKVKIKKLFFGKYLITITYKGKKYSCFSNNNFAYHRIKVSKVSNRTESLFYTLKNAYLTFYDECKAKNGFKI